MGDVEQLPAVSKMSNDLNVSFGSINSFIFNMFMLHLWDDLWIRQKRVTWAIGYALRTPMAAKPGPHVPGHIDSSMALPWSTLTLSCWLRTPFQKSDDKIRYLVALSDWPLQRTRSSTICPCMASLIH